MKIEAKPYKKIPDLKEFRHLGSLLTRSFVQIENLYPKSQEVTFEICAGHMWIMKGHNFYGTISGDLLDNKSDNLDLIALELQQVCFPSHGCIDNQ